MRLAVLAAILLVALTRSAGAHSSPPALLQFTQVPGGLSVEFRVPRLDGALPELEVVLPPDLLDIATPTTVELPDAELRRRMVSGTSAALAGQRIVFPGLELTGIDVLVREGGDRPWTAVARAAAPYVICPPGGSLLTTATAFAAQGVRHILFGPDHLLFILGLLLLVRNRRALILTVSSFTLAHSATMAIAAYGLVVPPTALINAWIALSILYLGVEISASRRGEATLTAHYPWAAAFGFGLLHGFGFASALTEAGLARSDLATALLAFNVGVEAGQFGVIALAIVLTTGFANLRFPRNQWLANVPGFSVGVLGAFWTIETSLTALGVMS